MATLLGYIFYCTDHIKVDINTENFLPLSSVLEDVSAEKKKTSLVNNLTGLITASVIAIHGINDPRVQSGRLGAHREWNDRQYVSTNLQWRGRIFFEKSMCR